MVFKKIIFQSRYVALETPSRPPPFMASTISNFHFDYLNTSLRSMKGAAAEDDDQTVQEIVQLFVRKNNKS